QKSEAESAALALVGSLHHRHMAVGERLDEDTRRARDPYRPVAERVAQPRCPRQPLVQKARRTGYEPAADFARLVIDRLLDDDFRHGSHAARSRRGEERFMNFSWTEQGKNWTARVSSGYDSRFVEG